MKKIKTGFAVIAVFFLLGTSNADITGTVEDPGEDGIEGVRIQQLGDPDGAVLSGADGSFTLTTSQTVLKSRKARGGVLLTEVPLAMGDDAFLRIFTTSGRNIFNGTLSHDRNAVLRGLHKGIYWVKISSRDLDVKRSFVFMGEPIAFEAVAHTGTADELFKKFNAVQAPMPIVFSKDGYAVKTFMLEDGQDYRIGFGAPIGRTFDPEAYPKYEGFNLEIAEEFTTTDWPDGLTWDGNFVSNDVVWEPSDGGFNENIVRFQPEGIHFENDMMVLRIENQPAAGNDSHSEGDNISDSDVLFVGDKAMSGGEVRSAENNYRFGRYEMRMKPPDPANGQPGTADGFLATMFIFHTPKQVNWRETDFEVLGNNEILTQHVYNNNTLSWCDPCAAGDTQHDLPGDFDFRDWHEYAFEWLPDQVNWYVDGQLIRTYNHPVDGQPDQSQTEIGWLSAKIIMNFWIFNPDWGGLGGNSAANTYPIDNNYDWFRFYRWDQDGDKDTYPETVCRLSNSHNC
jgi:hypothetical protein